LEIYKKGILAMARKKGRGKNRQKPPECAKNRQTEPFIGMLHTFYIVALCLIAAEGQTQNTG